MTEVAGNDEGRVYQMCDSCGQVDTHPRHIQWVNPGDGVTTETVNTTASRAAADLGDDVFQAVAAQIADTTRIQKHFDCCAADGCGVCATIHNESGNAHGLELAEYATQRGADESLAHSVGGQVVILADSQVVSDEKEEN